MAHLPATVTDYLESGRFTNTYPLFETKLLLDFDGDRTSVTAPSRRAIGEWLSDAIKAGRNHLVLPVIITGSYRTDHYTALIYVPMSEWNPNRVCINYLVEGSDLKRGQCVAMTLLTACLLVHSPGDAFSLLNAVDLVALLSDFQRLSVAVILDHALLLAIDEKRKKI